MNTRRHVELAVDAAGVSGGRTYTYHVPPALDDLVAGEAVLVEYGRRQALAVVLGEAEAPTDVETKPVLERVRSDGPLLPPLGLRLAQSVADHYLAPPALVIRQMLPPGMLERLEQVAVWRGDQGATHDESQGAGHGAPPDADAKAAPGQGADPGLPPALVEALTAAGEAGIATADLPALGSRATTVRHLRAATALGQVDLVWRLRADGVGPRLERRVSLTEAGRGVIVAFAAPADRDAPAARLRLGPRQRALLADLAAAEAAAHAAADGTADGAADGASDGTADGAGVPEAGATATMPATVLAQRHGASGLKRLADRGLIELHTVQRKRNPGAGRIAPTAPARPPDSALSAGQLEAVELVGRLAHERRYMGVLLEGVTAGGKTAVYAAAIADVLQAGRGALVLVPEIALAIPLLDRLAPEVGEGVALLHSALSEGERADEWRRVRSGAARVVVGTRLAVLAPIADPGVIIVDEEHDPAYKADRTPRYQARDVALRLGQLTGCPVLLGSATQDVATLGRAQRGELVHLRLPERLGGSPPAVEVVDLRRELHEGNRGMLSRPLRDALEALEVDKGARAILLLNRRGSASVVLCRDCGYVQICPECQRPLVFHASGLSLRCHHCGASAPVALRCPACASPRIR
ncbi:hypothetical protein BH20CHL6_BH20CHL6_10450 [soil metagenome]